MKKGQQRNNNMDLRTGPQRASRHRRVDLMSKSERVSAALDEYLYNNPEGFDLRYYATRYDVKDKSLKARIRREEKMVMEELKKERASEARENMGSSSTETPPADVARRTSTTTTRPDRQQRQQLQQGLRFPKRTGKRARASPERIKAACDEYFQSHPSKYDIAKKYGLHPSTVFRNVARISKDLAVAGGGGGGESGKNTKNSGMASNLGIDHPISSRRQPEQANVKPGNPNKRTAEPAPATVTADIATASTFATRQHNRPKTAAEIRATADRIDAAMEYIINHNTRDYCYKYIAKKFGVGRRTLFGRAAKLRKAGVDVPHSAWAGGRRKSFRTTGSSGAGSSTRRSKRVQGEQNPPQQPIAAGSAEEAIAAITTEKRKKEKEKEMESIKKSFSKWDIYRMSKSERVDAAVDEFLNGDPGQSIPSILKKYNIGHNTLYQGVTAMSAARDRVENGNTGLLRNSDGGKGKSIKIKLKTGGGGGDAGGGSAAKPQQQPQQDRDLRASNRIKDRATKPSNTSTPTNISNSNNTTTSRDKNGLNIRYMTRRERADAAWEEFITYSSDQRPKLSYFAKKYGIDKSTMSTRKRMLREQGVDLDADTATCNDDGIMVVNSDITPLPRTQPQPHAQQPRKVPPPSTTRRQITSMELSDIQERYLVNWYLREESLGRGAPTRARLTSMALSLLFDGQEPQLEVEEEEWLSGVLIRRFLKRNPEIKAMMGETTEEEVKLVGYASVREVGKEEAGKKAEREGVRMLWEPSAAEAAAAAAAMNYVSDEDDWEDEEEEEDDDDLEDETDSDESTSKSEEGDSDEDSEDDSEDDSDTDSDTSTTSTSTGLDHLYDQAFVNSLFVKLEESTPPPPSSTHLLHNGTLLPTLQSSHDIQQYLSAIQDSHSATQTAHIVKTLCTEAGKALDWKNSEMEALREKAERLVRENAELKKRVKVDVTATGGGHDDDCAILGPGPHPGRGFSHPPGLSPESQQQQQERKQEEQRSSASTSAMSSNSTSNGMTMSMTMTMDSSTPPHAERDSDTDKGRTSMSSSLSAMMPSPPPLGSVNSPMPLRPLVEKGERGNAIMVTETTTTTTKTKTNDESPTAATAAAAAKIPDYNVNCFVLKQEYEDVPRRSRQASSTTDARLVLNLEHGLRTAGGDVEGDGGQGTSEDESEEESESDGDGESESESESESDTGDESGAGTNTKQQPRLVDTSTPTTASHDNGNSNSRKRRRMVDIEVVLETRRMSGFAHFEDIGPWAGQGEVGTYTTGPGGLGTNSKRRRITER